MLGGISTTSPMVSVHLVTQADVSMLFGLRVEKLRLV